MSNIPVGSTLIIRVEFIVNDTLVNPDAITSFSYTDLDYIPSTLDETFTITNISTGLYEFEWTPSAAGRYLLQTTGTFVSIGDFSVVHDKYFIIGDVEPQKTLGATQQENMLGILEPMYVDPEDILAFYPDGDLVEIAQIINKKSWELESKVGCSPIRSITALQYDFVVAATMCELSRKYGSSNNGFNGFSGADSFQLGDLSVDSGGSSSRLASGKYDFGNADSWCELASSLKMQLNSVKDTFRPVVAGSAFDSPVIVRDLKSSDF